MSLMASDLRENASEELAQIVNAPSLHDGLNKIKELKSDSKVLQFATYSSLAKSYDQKAGNLYLYSYVVAVYVFFSMIAFQGVLGAY